MTVYVTRLDEYGKPIGEPEELKGVTANFTLADEPQEEFVLPDFPLSVEFDLTPEEAANLQAFFESIWGPVDTWPKEENEEHVKDLDWEHCWFPDYDCGW